MSSALFHNRPRVVGQVTNSNLSYYSIEFRKRNILCEHLVLSGTLL
jgi:hypothetical protein